MSSIRQHFRVIGSIMSCLTAGKQNSNICKFIYHLPTKCSHPWSMSPLCHNNDVIMTTMASQITSVTIVYLTVYLGADQRKHKSSASLAFVLGIHRLPVNSPHKGPVTRKMFPFDDVIMATSLYKCTIYDTRSACHRTRIGFAFCCVLFRIHTGRLYPYPAALHQ